ncbi:DUF5914 domain-containing protein [Streptomyces fagopyri]
MIAEALKQSQGQPSGNWFVVGATRDIRNNRPLGRTVAGHEVVVWRDARDRLVAGPGACPHLGAPLRNSPVHCGTLVCHWHGLALKGTPFAGWEPLPVHDDGVLVWVRLDEVGGETPSSAPTVITRPNLSHAVSVVYENAGTCEPEDIIANRLDPWHGAWFHPYSFVDLAVVNALDTPDTATTGVHADNSFTIDVSFKVAGRLVVPVRAVFTAPEPRTIAMHITKGEGRGSVVETHATPLGPDEHGNPRTAIIEAIMAVSDRRGFAAVRTTAPVLRPLMRAAAGRLWRDDLAYAERRWALRSAGRDHDVKYTQA